MRKLNFERLHAASKVRMRNINETIILNLIRDKQPISRVEITNKTGLQVFPAQWDPKLGIHVT